LLRFFRQGISLRAIFETSVRRRVSKAGRLCPQLQTNRCIGLTDAMAPT